MAFVVKSFLATLGGLCWQACYGPTVNAYFMFSRWILLNFLILCAISLAFLLKHITRGSFGWATFVQYYMPDLFVPSSYQST
jgi:hypothetical protein